MESPRCVLQAEILKLVDHPNIISLFDYFDSPTDLYLVMELARGGDIIDRLGKVRHYSEPIAAATARQILLALSHCHKRGIVHCDLKPDNILLATDDENSPVKIADFGFAQLVPRKSKLSEPCGTPEYVAPEVLSEDGYDCSADMWSFGVILYVLLSGELPWKVDSKLDMSVKLDCPPPWILCMTSARDALSES